MTAEPSIGRYAPSPSGALHRGSLVAALASFLHARAQGGRWLLRIDDIDSPRVVAGADRRIIDTLAAFHLVHDGHVLYQSSRRDPYASALGDLLGSRQAFHCGCTRRESLNGPPGLEGPVYPGTCRHGLPRGRSARSVRLAVDDREIAFQDAIQGRYAQRLATDIGDFVIRRADRITAYQLATVVDDGYQGVTEVVRGADLLTSTPRQIFIAEALGLALPAYAHIPVLVDDCGQKLGKSDGSLAVSPSRRSAQLWQCLVILGQNPPETLHDVSLTRLLAWAVDNWNLASVPRQATLTVP